MMVPFKRSVGWMVMKPSWKQDEYVWTQSLVGETNSLDSMKVFGYRSIPTYLFESMYICICICKMFWKDGFLLVDWTFLDCQLNFGWVELLGSTPPTQYTSDFYQTPSWWLASWKVWLMSVVLQNQTVQSRRVPKNIMGKEAVKYTRTCSLTWG